MVLSDNFQFLNSQTMIWPLPILRKFVLITSSFIVCNKIWPLPMPILRKFVLITRMARDTSRAASEELAS